MCSRCYRTFSKDTVNIVYPKQNIDINKEVNIHFNGTYDNNQSENESNTSNESVDSNDPDENDECDQNESNPMLEFVTFLEQDITLDQTSDNVVNNVGFETTHTGLNAINVNQNDSTLTISGHVIFNQVGSCTMRRNNNINGTSRQKI